MTVDNTISKVRNDRAYPFENGAYKGNPYIQVTDLGVVFTGQTGPIKEVGLNGCQIDDLISFSRDVIKVFNDRVSCTENTLVIQKLEEALLYLDARKKARESRGVEGTSNA